MQDHWHVLTDVAGAIDGTNYEQILYIMPYINQGGVFLGHQNSHCLHTQVVIDSNVVICYV